MEPFWIELLIGLSLVVVGFLTCCCEEEECTAYRLVNCEDVGDVLFSDDEELEPYKDRVVLIDGVCRVVRCGSSEEMDELDEIEAVYEDCAHCTSPTPTTHCSDCANTTMSSTFAVDLSGSTLANKGAGWCDLCDLITGEVVLTAFNSCQFFYQSAETCSDTICSGSRYWFVNLDLTDSPNPCTWTLRVGLRFAEDCIPGFQWETIGVYQFEQFGASPSVMFFNFLSGSSNNFSCDGAFPAVIKVTRLT